LTTKVGKQKQILLFSAMPKLQAQNMEPQSMANAKKIVLHLLLSMPKVGG